MGQCWGEETGQEDRGGNAALLWLTPLGLSTSQSPRHRPQEQVPASPQRDKAPHSRALMISTPSCSAPCKAFSLNSLPFSRTAAAHICGNQATATPPTRPERLPQPWSPCPKFPFCLQVRNLPTVFHSTCYFQDSAYIEGAELRSFPSGQRVLTLLCKMCLKRGDGEQEEKKSSWVLIPPQPPTCCATLGKPLSPPVCRMRRWPNHGFRLPRFESWIHH